MYHFSTLILAVIGAWATGVMCEMTIRWNQTYPRRPITAQKG